MKILIDEKGRKHLVDSETYQTDLGIVTLENDKIFLKSHTGHNFIVLDSDIVDLYERMPRAGSYMMKKDIGQFLAHLGPGCGDTIIDGGSGSGALLLYMGSIVGKEGKVISYEVNRDFAEIARKNMEKAGLSSVVEIKNRDVTEGFEEKNGSADIVTLDMNEAWNAVNEARRVLKPGGRIGIYTIYVEHAKKVSQALFDSGFIEVKTFELIEREMEFRNQGTRPRTSRLGHSGYQTIARKTD